MARADYDALEATAYLLRAPSNAKRLLESLEQARAGDRQTHELA
jgi:antitoxin YefM